MSPIFSERSCSGVILYIEDVDLNFLNGSLVIHPLVILYIEDVDLNNNICQEIQKLSVILYIEDVDLNAKSL